MAAQVRIDVFHRGQRAIQYSGVIKAEAAAEKDERKAGIGEAPYILLLTLYYVIILYERRKIKCKLDLD